MRPINLLLSLTLTLSRTPTCDGKTDGRTQGHSIYPALRACKGKSIIGRFTATFLGPFCPEAILAGGGAVLTGKRPSYPILWCAWFFHTYTLLRSLTPARRGSQSHYSSLPTRRHRCCCCCHLACVSVTTLPSDRQRCTFTSP